MHFAFQVSHNQHLPSRLRYLLFFSPHHLLAIRPIVPNTPLRSCHNIHLRGFVSTSTSRLIAESADDKRFNDGRTVRTGLPHGSQRVVEGLISPALFLVAVEFVTAPATIGRHDQLTKRDVQYARYSSSGELESIEKSNRPQHAFANLFPSAYCIDHLRAATKTAAHKRRLFAIHLAILLVILCIDGFAIYRMNVTAEGDIW